MKKYKSPGITRSEHPIDVDGVYKSNFGAETLLIKVSVRLDWSTQYKLRV